MKNKEKMNVLFITHYSGLYGANKSMLNLINGLSNKINPIVILLCDGDLVTELIKLEVPYYIIKYKRIAYRLTSIRDFFNLFYSKISYPYFYSGFKKKIKEIDKLFGGISIVHSNSGVFNVGLKVANDLSIKHIWHLREFQNLDYNLKLIILKRNYYNQLKSSDSIVAISKSIAEHFGISDIANVVYNGVQPLERFKKPLENREDYFIFCGLLTKNKGIEDAIDAFYLYTKAIETSTKFLIFGDAYNNEYLVYLTEKIKEYKLSERIILMGYSKEIIHYMSKAMALLMCSKYEAMGRVTVEAMSVGCPVIGFNSTGTADVITDNETGYLYNDIEELKEKMLFIKNNNEQVSRVAFNAYEYAKSNFSEEVYSERIYNIYLDAIK